MPRSILRFFRAAIALALVLQLPCFAQAPAGADAKPPTFDILEFDVDGNTVLADAVIERAVTPFLGEGRQMAAVEDARAALEKAYQSAGYLSVFVDVPEQRVDGGVVRLQVLEGKVARLKVSGSRYFSQGYIREKVPELADGKVPNFNEVQRQLALVNRTEDRRVQPIMKAGAVPGTIETELKVDDKLPLYGNVELNNRAAAQTKPLRLSATVRYDNLWQRDHSVAVTVATAPQDTTESRVATLNYSMPADDGATWLGYVIHSDSNVAAIGDVNVLGKGTTLGLRRAQSLLAPADEVHSISYGLDVKHIEQETHAGASVVSTPLLYLPLQFAYNGSFDHGPRSATLLSLQTTAAFRNILRRNVDCPGGRADQFACSRQGGDGSFASLRAGLRQSIPLGASGAALNVRADVQVATGPLPSGEQFTAGGAETVRGYYEAEAAGDRGFLGSLELRTPELGAGLSRWLGSDARDPRSAPLSQTYGLLFVEGARTWVFEPATGQSAHMAIGGAGLGLRVRVRQSTVGEFDLAWPVRSTPTTEAGDLRAHFKLAVDF